MYSQKNKLKKRERKSIVQGIKDQDPKVVISMLWWNATSLERCPGLCTSRFHMSQARPRTISSHGWHGSLRPRQDVYQPRDRWTLSLSSISEFWQSILHRTENILEGRWFSGHQEVRYFLWPLTSLSDRTPFHWVLPLPLMLSSHQFSTRTIFQL